MVYVEGPDDIPFWDDKFSAEIPSSNYEIESVNGKENLDAYIAGVLSGSIKNVIIAIEDNKPQAIQVLKATIQVS